MSDESEKPPEPPSQGARLEIRRSPDGHLILYERGLELEPELRNLFERRSLGEHLDLHEKGTMLKPELRNLFERVSNSAFEQGLDKGVGPRGRKFSGPNPGEEN